MKRYLLYLFPLALLACSSCVNSMEEVEALSANNNTKMEMARHIKTYYYGSNGMLKGIMTAPLLYRYMTDTPYLKLPEGLKVRFYEDSLQLQSILTAKEGIYYENSDNITVKDSVVVTTKDGRKLETEVLHWDPKKQQFYTNKPFVWTTPTQVIHGRDGLIAPPDLSWYELKKVSGPILIDSSFTGTP